jgi:membrane-bound lytic murein transglycosylase A
VKDVGASGITKAEMAHTVSLLQDVQLLQPAALRDRFDFYRIKTSDSDDRVRITGYYTPILKASKKRSSAFPVPLYKRPKKNVPNPAAIEAGALKGRGLEICYVASKKELKNAQLQGSCLVEYPDGHREFLGFGGSVRGTGGTYVFFTPIGDRVLGSGSFPLTAGYSIAVDPRYIPLGSTFLVELPDLDAAGKQKGTTYRIVFAQDRGGAIKTTKRIDMYCGVGAKGLEEARKINRYGRMWLLLPKQ